MIAKRKIQEAIDVTLDEAIHAIKFNLCGVLGGMLYGLKLEMEKDDGVGAIDTLISEIINTSCYTGPDDEQWPTWSGEKRSLDERGKQAIEAKNKIEKHLRRHGICQNTNLSKNFPLFPGETIDELEQQINVLTDALVAAQRAYQNKTKEE